MNHSRTQHTNPDDVADWAHDYAAANWRVLPIRPGHKTPALTAWVDNATSDPQLTEHWWNGLYRSHGIGIALGEHPDHGWVFAVDIDTHNGDGPEEWRQLSGTSLDELNTPWAHTGGGGIHILYTAPNEVRNTKIADNIDIRGNGGQIVVEPTLHPNGTPYEWVIDPIDHQPQPAPQWLLEAISPPEPTSQPQQATTHNDRPGDLWAAQTSWEELLLADGWQPHHKDADGTQHWTRPGKNPKDGPSATIGYGGYDQMKVFTTSLTHMGLHAEQTYSKLGYLAATRHNGNIQAAAQTLHNEGWHTNEDLTSWIEPTSTNDQADNDPDLHGWEPANPAHLEDGYQPPTPTIGVRTDGTALFYPQRINALYAPSGTGKSWIAMWACSEAIHAGHHIIYIDYEDHYQSIAARFTALGHTLTQIQTQITYINPDQPYNPAAHIWLTQHIQTTNPAIVVIDSTGEAMALDGASPNDDDHTARWFRRLPRHIAQLGPAVILTDHVPKSRERERNFAIGSQRKRAAIDGAAYEITARTSPSHDKDGHLTLTVAKDRNGTHANGTNAGELHITHNGNETLTIICQAPPTHWRPTVLMGRISDYLTIHQPASANTITKEVTGKTDKLRTAIKLMVEDGYLQDTPGGYRLIKPYSDTDAITSHD